MASSSMLHSIMFPGCCSLWILKKLLILLNGPSFLIGNDEVKISQYSDDTTLILDGSEKSLTSAMDILLVK